MTKVYVVLFDDKERRGWLVNGAAAIVRLVRAQLSVPPYSDSRQLCMDEFVHAKQKGGDAAEEALLDERSRSMRVEKDWDFSRERTFSEWNMKRETKHNTRILTVQDLVRQVWRVIELLSTHQDKVKPVHLHTTPRKKLEGWSLKETIEGDNRMEPRVITLEASGKSWVDFTRSIHAVTLFGRGIGDLIVLSRQATVCPFWRNVPHGQDNLAASVFVLRDIWDKYGDEGEAPLRFTEDAV